MDTHRRRLPALLAVFLLALFFFLRSSYGSDRSSRKPASSPLTPANSTLGFGAIVAVSHKTSPRKEDLLYAANLTGLDIVVPEQPVWTQEDEDNFRSPNGTRVSHGSMLAWFGHLNALTWFLSTDLESALIIEDDVDWDISLRLSQIPRASHAFNTLLHTTSRYSSSSSQNNQPHYWSDLSKWEILYLGHCGDFFHADKISSLDYELYSDPTVPPQNRMHDKTADFLEEIGMPENHRMIHRSKWPLCTFGYAVTRASAQRLLDEYSLEGEKGCQAYDVRILEACRDHGWACYTANPELLHHIDAPSEIKSANEGASEESLAQADDYRRQGTWNIRCGARSKALKTDDPETLQYLKQMVGEKGVCLVDQMQEDKSRWP